jgi:putative serine protease PepD
MEKRSGGTVETAATIGEVARRAGYERGVVIDKEGHILTNNHVAEAGEDGGNLTVTFSDGTTADLPYYELAPRDA